MISATLLALVLGGGIDLAAQDVFREDTNRDGAVNVTDALLVVLTAREGIYRPEKDYDLDGAVSLDDARALCRALAEGTRTPVPAVLGSPQLTTIDGATFVMGNNDGDANEKPEHTVTISPFRLGRHEITNRQYASYLNEALELGAVEVVGNSSVVAVDGKYTGKELLYLMGKSSGLNRCWIIYSGGVFTVSADRDNWPVVYVTWHGAASYAAHHSYRLPTEAEWECAASSAGTVRYATYNGQADSTSLNFDNTVGHPVSAGSYPAGPYALHDMSGNIWEYCADYFGAYPDSAEVNPTGPDEGDVHVRRGGGWNSCVLTTTATARTDQDNPDHRGPGIGFRVAADIVE